MMRCLIYALFLLISLVTSSAFAADAWRTFTDLRGRKIEAKIIRLESDFVLVELKSNGKQFPIKLKDLGEEDVNFLKSHHAALPDSATPSLFEQCRERFGPKRKTGARKMRGKAAAADELLWTARDLRVGVE